MPLASSRVKVILPIAAPVTALVFVMFNSVGAFCTVTEELEYSCMPPLAEAVYAALGALTSTS